MSAGAKATLFVDGIEVGWCSGFSSLDYRPPSTATTFGFTEHVPAEFTCDFEAEVLWVNQNWLRRSVYGWTRNEWKRFRTSERLRKPVSRATRRKAWPGGPGMPFAEFVRRYPLEQP